VVSIVTLSIDAGSLWEQMHLLGVCFGSLCLKGRGKAEISSITCYALVLCFQACLTKRRNKRKMRKLFLKKIARSVAFKKKKNKKKVLQIKCFAWSLLLKPNWVVPYVPNFCWELGFKFVAASAQFVIE